MCVERCHQFGRDVGISHDRDLLARYARSIGERDLRRDIIALGRRVGIENLTPYCLRTTVTSILSESDAVPPEQLADLLGHVDTTMVMRHYRKRITRSVNVAAGLGSRLAAGSQP